MGFCLLQNSLPPVREHAQAYLFSSVYLTYTTLMTQLTAVHSGQAVIDSKQSTINMIFYIKSKQSVWRQTGRTKGEGWSTAN